MANKSHLQMLNTGLTSLRTRGNTFNRDLQACILLASEHAKTHNDVIGFTNIETKLGAVLPARTMTQLRQYVIKASNGSMTYGKDKNGDKIYKVSKGLDFEFTAPDYAWHQTAPAETKEQVIMDKEAALAAILKQVARVGKNGAEATIISGIVEDYLASKVFQAEVIRRTSDVYVAACIAEQSKAA